MVLLTLCFVVFWWTGVDNFYDGIEDMIGYRPNPWMKWSWTIITPVLCMVRDDLLFFLFFSPRFIAVLTVTATRRIDTVKVWALQRALKVSRVCFPGLFCLLSGEIQALDL